MKLWQERRAWHWCGGDLMGLFGAGSLLPWPTRGCCEPGGCAGTLGVSRALPWEKKDEEPLRDAERGTDQTAS